MTACARRPPSPLQNVTSQSTACHGTVSNGQAVQVAACNDLTAQKWTVEKRTAGDYKDTYRLVSQLEGAKKVQTSLRKRPIEI